jgi:hypothetical protein
LLLPCPPLGGKREKEGALEKKRSFFSQRAGGNKAERILKNEAFFTASFLLLSLFPLVKKASLFLSAKPGPLFFLPLKELKV